MKKPFTMLTWFSGKEGPWARSGARLVGVLMVVGSGKLVQKETIYSQGWLVNKENLWNTFEANFSSPNLNLNPCLLKT